MKCIDVIEKLEQLSPPQFAEDWDNVGLLCGKRSKNVDRVYLALDATDYVVEEAIRLGCDMIITHHPLIFKSIKNVSDDDFIGRRIVAMLGADISYYAMHTNFDVMGMADAASDVLELKNRDVLDVTYEDDISKEGIGRFGDLPREMTLFECAEFVRDRFNINGIRVYGDKDQTVYRAAICPGSGSDMIEAAVKGGADVLITGDIGHHTGIDAVAKGLPIIDASHYGLEKIFVPYMKDYIARELPGLKVYCASEKGPYFTV